MNSFWLVLEEGGNALGRFAYPLRQGTNILGRSSTCDIVILDSHISREHVSISLSENGTVTVKDLGSGKGTLVDGEQISEQAIRTNSRITVDQHTFRLVKELPQPQRGQKKDVGKSSDKNWSPFKMVLDGLLDSEDPKKLLEKLLDGATSLTGAERGFVLLRTGPTGKFSAVASNRLENSQEQEVISKTVCVKAVKENKLLTIDDSTQDTRCAEAPSLAQAVKPRSIICGPLSSGGKTLGVLYLDMAALSGGISNDTIKVITTVIDFASELLSAEHTRRHLLETRDRMAAVQRLSLLADQMVIGDDKASAKLDEMINTSAEQDISVLITGETGTGKEMVARALHIRSARSRNMFVPVNCSALPRDTLEAELFGVVKGAFTGATEDRMGRIELAAGGTLFLDEIGELDLEAQVKLLRVLQERLVTPLGSSKSKRVDFRLVCATNANLEKLVEEGLFRQDLYYRINVMNIHVPTLRDRSASLIKIAEHFLHQFTCLKGKPQKKFTKETKQSLLKHSWPGNIRELRNVVEHAVVMCGTKEISPEHLPLSQHRLNVPNVDSSGEVFIETLPTAYEEAHNAFDLLFFKRLLAENGGNHRAVARESGLGRNTLARRLKKLGIA